MIINKANIKTLLGITSTAYDTKIDACIPIVMDNIIESCNNPFLFKNINGYVYNNASMTFTSTTLTLNTHDISLDVGDWFRIHGSLYNDGIYQIKTIVGEVITIETSKNFRVETLRNGIIALMDIPSNLINVFCDYVNDEFVNVKHKGVVTEKIDDYSIQYGNRHIADYITRNNYILCNYRNTYKDKILNGYY